MPEKIKEPSKKSQSNKKIYIWLFCLTVLVIGFIGLSLGNWLKISSGTLKLEFKSVEAYVKTLITIAGFLVAFSAISIYSIFNANVDSEKERIDKLRSECERQIEYLEIELEKAKNSHEKDISTSLKAINDLVINQKKLSDLTSNYSTHLKKREAIKHFGITPSVTEETKDFISNYFKSLDEKNKANKFYIELEELLHEWGMIDE